MMEMPSLDDDLAAWAVSVRLPDTEADVIFRQITATPVRTRPIGSRVDPAWWRHFNADFTARMVSSTRPVRAAA
jgi:hypothetical protein